MKKDEKIIKIGDIIVIAALLLTSVVIFLTSLTARDDEVTKAVVSIDGKEYARYSLSVDREVAVEQDGHLNVIEIKDGKVRVKNADCPDQTCVHQGWISRGGEVIVCLPARLTVTLDGAQEQLDTIVY